LTQSCTEETTTPSSGGGGGGGTTTTSDEGEVINGTSNSEFDELVVGQTSVITMNDSEFGLTDVSFDVTENISGASISITEVDSRDEATLSLSVFGDFATFESFSVEKTGITNEQIEEAVINFKITKQWTEDSFGFMAPIVATNYVKMYKREDNLSDWQAVETNLVDEDETYYYYTAISDGFSIFVYGFDTAILVCEVGEERCVEGALRKCVEDGESTNWEQLEICEEGCLDEYVCVQEKGFSFKDIKISYLVTLGLLIVFVVLAFVIFKFLKESSGSKSEAKVKKAKETVSKKVNEGKKK
jgi:PGF-pre-PGF domain-containing protein